MTQCGFFFDESRCTDCRACSLACRDWNDLQPGDARYLRRFTWEEGLFPEVQMHTLFAPCYHCENPACVAACAQGAVFKEGKYGAVLVDSDACVGCESCYDACPYGAPRFRDGKMEKCTMCIDRLEKGDKPVCVNSCIVRALDFGPVEELRAKYGDMAAVDGMPDGSAVKPAFVVKLAQPKKQVVPFDAAKARELFGQRNNISPLYEDDVYANVNTSAICARNLDMKLPEKQEIQVYASQEF